MKTKTELAEFLREIAKEIQQADQSEEIKRLRGSLDYYIAMHRQDEIKIIRLETRLAEIRSLLNGAGDKL